MIVAFLITGAVLFCLSIWLIVRNNQVRELRLQLLDEEAKWLCSNTQRWDVRRGFRRYSALPSYDKMVLSVWKRVSSFRKELKPIEEYYLR